MNIKTICKLYLKREEGFCSYTDYEVYPLAAIFANSNDDAIKSYITNMTNIHIEIQECVIMETTLACGHTLCFYRVKGRNTTSEHDFVEYYTIIDVPFICS